MFRPVRRKQHFRDVAQHPRLTPLYTPKLVQHTHPVANSHTRSLRASAKTLLQRCVKGRTETSRQASLTALYPHGRHQLQRVSTDCRSFLVAKAVISDGQVSRRQNSQLTVAQPCSMYFRPHKMLLVFIRSIPINRCGGTCL